MDKKNISSLVVFITLFITLFPLKVNAVPGCCSSHKGEVGCKGNRTVCGDGWISSCLCDGTSSNYEGSGSSSNNSYNNDNTQSESTSPFTYIIGLIIAFGGIWFLGYFIDFYGNAKENRKRNQKAQEETKYKQMQEELKKQKDIDVENIVSNGNENSNYIDKIDGQSICRFTSDDLLKIISSNNSNIFYIIDLINDKKNSYTEWEIFNKLYYKIVENQKLSSLQNKCAKYLIEKRLVHSYENIFLITLQNEHISLINYILNSCNDINFEFRVNCETNKSYTELIFEKLLKINDLSLAKKISKKTNFLFNIGIKLFEKEYEYNDVLKYQLLSIFANNVKNSNINIESIFEKEIKVCNDDEEIIKRINSYLVINYLLEDKGYYLVYLLTKRQKVNCIEYLLNNCNSINLDKLIVNSSDEKINGLTPLIYACYRKSNKIVKMLLEYGADGNFTDINGEIPLSYVCDLKNLKLAKLFYDKGYRFKKDEDNEKLEYCLKNKELYLLPVSYVNKLYKLTKKGKK